MPLLVVPLGEHETHLLTLAEWDALNARRRVWFERPAHPLLPRLAEAGVACGVFDDEPESDMDDAALVADPGSPRVVSLARGGADVTCGAARPPDALTAAHAAPAARRAGASLGTLVAIMARLRSDDGCPWDREQTHLSLKTHALEEVYEVVEAIDSALLGAELAEELGDLLLQVLFHARLAEQDGRFDIADVADAIAAKLLRRHPHVFGNAAVADAAEVVRNWESIKRSEKDRSGPFDEIPAALPALLAAAKTLKRSAALGFQPSEAENRAALDDALARDDFGAALLRLAGLARGRGEDPETALLAALARFRHALS